MNYNKGANIRFFLTKERKMLFLTKISLAFSLIWKQMLDLSNKNLSQMKFCVLLQPICGAERLNRESGVSPEQFPLL